MIKTILAIFSLSAILGSSYSQVQFKDLKGLWTSCNYDSSFFKLDTIKFHQDPNFSLSNDCCYSINWEIRSGRKIKLKELYSCTEPGRVSELDEQNRIILKKDDGRQILVIKGEQRIESFHVLEYQKRRVDRYPYEIKNLTLCRISSKLSDHSHIPR